MAGDDFVGGSNNILETVKIARLYQDAGVHLLSVTGGWHETRVPQITMNVPEGAFAYLAREIKKAVDIPVAASNRIRHKAFAEQLLKEGWCDLVNLGRPLIADPHLPAKWSWNRENEVLLCTGCNQGCFDPLFTGEPSTCTVNPYAGRESEWMFTSAGKKKKVLIIGAGPAGMNAAITAAERGHDVVLFEKEDEPGGMLRYAGLPPGREDWMEYLDYMKRQLEKAPVDINFSAKISSKEVLSIKPDALVVATGGEPVIPEIPGVHLDHVVSAIDVLAGRIKPGKRVVIIGGGGTGVEAALALAARGTVDSKQFFFLWMWGAVTEDIAKRITLRGTHEVTILKRSPGMGRGLSRSTRWVMIHELRKRGVHMYDGVTFHSISEEGITCTVRGEEKFFPADTVVIAAGLRPRREIYDELKEQFKEIYLIGDAASPRRALQAINEGVEIGLKI